MSYVNGNIIPPVTIGDIQQVLGQKSNDLGRFCTHSTLNMWAKYKPVRWNSPDTLSALNQAKTGWNPNASAADAWWKGNDNKYGLNFIAISLPTTAAGMITAFNNLATYIDSNMNGWEYLKPRGSNTAGAAYEYYRMLDFIGYNHQAARPIRGGATYDVYARADVDSEFEARVEYIETVDSDITTRNYIKPDDVVLNGTTLYRGIIIYKRVGTGSSTHYEAVAWCTGTQWIGGGIWNNESITLDSTYVETLFENLATYYILPVYFTCDLTQPTVSGRMANHSAVVQVSGHKVVPMPYIDILGFNAIQTARTVVLSNKIIATDYTYASDLSVLNTASAITTAYEAAIVNEEFTGNISTAPAGSYIATSVRTGTVTLPQGATTLVTSFNVTSGMSSNHIWSVYFKLDSDVYNIGLIQPATPHIQQ